ncbi:hypothetical protein QJS04_geneDACA018683 [Acorus gramineus]|uniref:Aminotransferase-like plant mobile domain-containing protein n=1 Tax=Acorus gramineus TaxID=55184 RepID=A0AAV9A461_ACOGR|nr:hypothetical protein QJS04_geneDACA018683 [Acorus gramineus]
MSDEEGHEVEEEERQDILPVDSDVDEDSIRGPFLGGPETNELLLDYRHHIAYRVWNGKGDRSLRCRQPAKTLDSWDLEKESLTFTDRVKQSGLWPLAIDKTGFTIPVAYLSLLVDIDRTGSFGWGSATLAHIYRQLGIASRANCKQISGYLTLLEVWVYEHLLFLSPAPDPTYDDQTPRSDRWIRSRNIPGLQKNSVEVIRELLDIAAPDQVDWDPYRSVRDRRPLSEFTFFKGCLCINSIFEPYMPDRVLRQFGHIQTVPRSPIRPQRVAKRNRSSTGYKAEYGGSVEQLEQWHDSVLSVASRGDRVYQSWDAVPDYIKWFERMSHRFVQNPHNRKLAQMASTSDVDTRNANAVQYLELLLDKRTTISAAQSTIRDVIHHLKDGTPLPDAQTVQRQSKQRPDRHR